MSYNQNPSTSSSSHKNPIDSVKKFFNKMTDSNKPHDQTQAGQAHDFANSGNINRNGGSMPQSSVGDVNTQRSVNGATSTIQSQGAGTSSQFSGQTGSQMPGQSGAQFPGHGASVQGSQGASIGTQSGGSQFPSGVQQGVQSAQEGIRSGLNSASNPSNQFTGSGSRM